VYDDGHGFCYSCGEYIPKLDIKGLKLIPSGSKHSPSYKKGPITGSRPSTLTDRRISKNTLEKYGVTVQYDANGDIIEHYYPYFKGQEMVATKVRVVPTKDFFSCGAINDADLFGANLVPAGGKYITITEGELDAMSVQEMMQYPAVSVKGAASAVRDVKQNYEYVNSFDNIIICFDHDEAHHKKDGSVFYPGQDAAKAVAKLFKAGKVKIVNLHPFKDANDFLKNGKVKEFERAWWNAEPYQLDGLVCGSSLWDEINKERQYSMVAYPFPGMTKRLYGLRTSEMVLLTATTGAGKTTLVKKIAHYIKDLVPEGSNIGLMMLEETLKETSLGLMSVQAGMPLHLPDCGATLEERRKAFEATLGTGKYWFHDHFGSTSIDNIVDKVDKLATQYDCKYIILDHISIIVSDQQQGDERRALDEIATKLKTFCINKDVCLIVVAHLKRVDGQSEGEPISLEDIRGTAALGQLSNVVIALERNTQDNSPITTVRCLKDRFAGRTGVVTQLEFNTDTYSFKEIEEVEASVESNKFTKEG